jgi:hypothetical protein
MPGNWVKFSWDLNKLPYAIEPLIMNVELELATAGQFMEIYDVVIKA